MGRPRSLAQVYREFGAVDDAGTSPLHTRVAVALSGSDEGLRVVEEAPVGRRHPALILAALDDLALAGHAPALAAAYASGDPDAAAVAAVDTLVRLHDLVVATATRRRIQRAASERCAVLHPVIAEAARRAGAAEIGLVEVDPAAGMSLQVDRVGITYVHRTKAPRRGTGPADEGRLTRVGDLASPVQVSATVVGDRPVPTEDLPAVVARIGVGPALLDLTDPADARWLRACLGPDRPDELERLEAELALVVSDPPMMRHGPALERLPDAVAQVPADALPVVITTWALSGMSPPDRLRFRECLVALAADRPVAWVSAEGVGVAPGIPALGDRPASGHSIVGLAEFDRRAARAEAVGRCWSRGRLLAWLADEA